MALQFMVDAHCDTLTVLDNQNRKLGEKSDQGQLDLPRMSSGGVNVQFFAVFLSPQYKDTALKRCLQFIDKFYMEINENKNTLELALNIHDIYKTTSDGKIAAVLTIEGGDALAGDTAILRVLYRLGVRSITLTWNGRNELGDGVGEGEAAGGLSVFGKTVVREMNDLGILIDVAHLADKGFWDVATISRFPFAATHANCRTICNHPRNLSDEQIQFIAKTGGVIGLTFVPDFVDIDKPNMETFIRHIDYIAMRFGTECIGLGSDFDGMDNVIPELHDVTCMPHLAEALLQRGYSSNDVSGIMGGNWMRLLNKVLK